MMFVDAVTGGARVPGQGGRGRDFVVFVFMFVFAVLRVANMHAGLADIHT